MQVEGSRVYRVKAVAEMLDVSLATVYRAIESGQLDAYKIGTGKGTLRVPEHALSVFLDACSEAAHASYVVGGGSAAQDDVATGDVTGAAAAGAAVTA